MQLVARWMTVIAVAFGLLAGATATTGAPAAVAEERCDGVWVVVDAREAGGSATSRCVRGDPGSGFEALDGAGHTYSFVPRIPGMVCVMDGRPDPCNGAPASAYWSYWHAELGGSWTYATRGAGERDPGPGDVEGWAFGAGDPPRVPPPSAPAASEPEPEPEPEPESAPAAEPQEEDSASEAGAGSDSGSADPSSPDDPGSEDEGAGTDAAQDDDASDDAPDGEDPEDEDRSLSDADGDEEADADGVRDSGTAADDEDEEAAGALATSAEEDGSLAGIIGAGALIVILASGAAWQSSRRRRS
jgi:hypothetical protein